MDLDGGEGGDGGSVRFFVNGSEYGSGFKSGVKGPVVLGVGLYCKSQKLTILPDAEKPAGEPRAKRDGSRYKAMERCWWYGQ